MAVYHLTRRQSREVDRIAIAEFGIPGLILMENAARGVVDVLNALNSSTPDAAQNPVTILCGKGNNGGDGLAIARHLAASATAVRIILFDPPDRFVGNAAVQLNIVTKMCLPIEQIGIAAADFEPTGVVIDAIYGTGFHPPSSIDFHKLNDSFRRCGANVLSIDVPSGMDADTGETGGGNAIRAKWTVSMMTPKRGFLHPDAGAFTGSIFTVDLGIPWSIVERAAA